MRGVPDSWERRKSAEVIPPAEAGAEQVGTIALLPSQAYVDAQARRACLEAATLARVARRTEALTVALEGARLLALGPVAPSAVRLLLRWLRETLSLFEASDVATLTVSPALAASLGPVWSDAATAMSDVCLEVDGTLHATEFRLTSAAARIDGRLSERVSRLAALLGVSPTGHAVEGMQEADTPSLPSA